MFTESVHFVLYLCAAFGVINDDNYSMCLPLPSWACKNWLCFPVTFPYFPWPPWNSLTFPGFQMSGHPDEPLLCKPVQLTVTSYLPK